VVGAGPRIGDAIARRFANDGFAVALLCRSDRSATAAELAGAWVPLDAADHAAVPAALDAVSRTLGPTSVLVCNAALRDVESPGGSASELTVENLGASLAVEPLGTLAAIRAVLPAMEAAGQGTIIVTGGGIALHPDGAWARLGVSKAATRGLVLSLAPTCAERGIHLATVAFVGGPIAAGSRLAPERIADVYAALHAEPRQRWRHEVVLGP
jgi:NAD(P)-dependent dehydrogenase (short-subunit alcohol dehydrogenase family)